MLYIDAENSGISGDIFLAGLLGLISNPNGLIEELIELKNYLSGISKLEIKLNKIKRHGLLVNQLEINLKESKKHRSAKIIVEALNKFLEDKKYSEPAKSYARNVLNSLIQAEQKVHGNLSDSIHLHELSSVDTLIDILGVTKVLSQLDIFGKENMVACSRIPLGRGTTIGAHGILPVPAPATLKILEKSGLTLLNGPVDAELVTPTGAALLVNLHPITNIKEISPENIVMSTGQKEFDKFLNVLRIVLGNKQVSGNKDLESDYLSNYVKNVTVLETAIDDVSGEIIGNLAKALENEEVMDFQILPSITKKNRPGYIIKVLCHPNLKYRIIELLIANLGTLGVRFNTVKRICVERTILRDKVEINSNFYDISYKISYFNTDKGKKIVNIKPEYEDIQKIATDTGLSIVEIQIRAQSQLSALFNKFKQDK
ncbi:MAG: nickel pincer cofactor biosynthesis protein LarC [Candidatus Lokiarchaeota archaeon]|nr:nickel pincer cofactor biosynthesis protein LarC [Candidatus Lokiarchaeota archaeon]